jgi:penicillin-binding protein 1A
MGFSGDYVTGVWIGNDDFRPMHNVTGGGIPAQAWHSFMSVAHASMNIRQIPGLPLHPTQVAERARIEELKRTQPQLAQELTATARGRDRLMSEKLKETLRKVAKMLRVAGGLPEPATEDRGLGVPLRPSPAAPLEGVAPPAETAPQAPTPVPRQRKAGLAIEGTPHARNGSQ